MLQFSFVLYELFWLAVFVFSARHALKVWGHKKAVLFFLPAILFGFGLEWATQTIFRAYHYGDGFLAYALNVPVSVSITWATLMYLAFCLSKEKLNLEPAWKASLVSAVLLVFVDLIHFEPFAKTFGFWTWSPEGFWFGAPLNNFYGWFWVVFLYLTAFQWIDKQNWTPVTKMAANLAAIPVNVGILELLLKAFNVVLGKV